VSNGEAVWLIQAQKGDEQAFTRLVEQYQNPVFNLCYRMLGDPYEAEDASQETFLKAYRAIRRYDNSRPFATWLLSIASHHCIDVIRRRRMQLVSIDSMPGETIPDQQVLPEAAVRLNEEQQQIQNLLGELSPTDRSAVILYYWYEHSYEEIAEALALTESAVKSRLHRARKVLAEAMQKQQAANQVTLERKQNESPAF
jgi:RNA polymerase sigma-70 factor, ECF subfamily